MIPLSEYARRLGETSMPRNSAIEAHVSREVASYIVHDFSKKEDSLRYNQKLDLITTPHELTIIP